MAKEIMKMKKTLVWIEIVLSISIFLLLCLLLYLFSSTTEMPFSLAVSSSFFNKPFDKPSPGNWVKENQILVYPDKVVIMLPNATISRYANTKSMDPLLDFSANGIEIKPKSPSDIHVGDIITYEKGNSLIVHRVIKIGIDEEGWFCITKGDNSPFPDEGKIRFSNIRFVTIAIIY